MLLLILTGCIVISVLLFAAPIIIHINGIYVKDEQYGRIEASWPHSSILRVSVNSKDNRFVIRLFNFFTIKRSIREIDNTDSKKTEEAGQTVNDNATEYDSQEKKTEHASQKNTSNEAMDKKHDIAAEKKEIKNRKKLDIFIKKADEILSGISFLSQYSELYSGLLHCFCKAAKSATNLLKIHSYNIKIRAGLDEPCETGRLFGYYTGISNVIGLNVKKNRRIDIEPVFNGQCMEMTGSVILYTSILRSVSPFFTIILTFPYRNMYGFWRANKKRIKVQ
jgi:hypothetical protein